MKNSKQEGHQLILIAETGDRNELNVMRKCNNECNDFPELKNKELGNMTLLHLHYNKTRQSTIKEQENYIQEMQIQMKTQQTNILAQFIA